MITAIDTNVLVAPWAGTPALATAARQGFSRAVGSLVIAAPVYAELVAAPQWDIKTIDRLLGTMQVRVDWDIDEPVWPHAALAYRGYAERRRAQRGDAGPRRILADFVIGAHAEHRAAFPTLSLDLLAVSSPPMEGRGSSDR